MRYDRPTTKTSCVNARKRDASPIVSLFIGVPMQCKTALMHAACLVTSSLLRQPIVETGQMPRKSTTPSVGFISSLSSFLCNALILQHGGCTRPGCSLNRQAEKDRLYRIEIYISRLSNYRERFSCKGAFESRFTVTTCIRSCSMMRPCDTNTLKIVVRNLKRV